MIESCAALVAAYGAVAYAVPWMPAPDVVARTDDPPPCATMRGTNVVQAVQQAEHVGVDGRAPDVEVRVEEPIGTRCPGVEERHIDPTEAVERDVGEVRHVVRARDVGGHADDRRATRASARRPRLEPIGAPGREHQLHPTVGERGRGRPTDPRRATGDHRDLPLEPHGQAVGWSTLTEVRFSAVQSNVPGFFGNTRTHFSSLICITR